MLNLYNIILNFLLILFSPLIIAVVILSKKYRMGIGERIGIIDKAVLAKLSGHKIIWFHAASVGETQALIPVIKELAAINNNLAFLVTTTSVNGRDRIIKEIKDLIAHACILPADFNFIIKGFFNKIKPSMLVIVETEFWPNLISVAHSSGIPVMLINGRISVKSFGLYRTFRFFFKHILDKFDVFVMQSEKMVVRLRMLGIDRKKTILVKNTKYSQETPVDPKVSSFDKRNKIIVVAGSIRKGEEETVIEGFRQALIYKGTLIVAPRHMNRVKDTEWILKRDKMKYVKWSEIREISAVPLYDAVIVDTIGDLARLYNYADIAIIGGGFKPYGGHNPMEAAMKSLPIIMGRNMFNFEDTSEKFVREGGAFMTDNNPQALAEKLNILAENPELRKKMGEINRSVVMSFAGSAATTAILVNEMILTGGIKGEI